MRTSTCPTRSWSRLTRSPLGPARRLAYHGGRLRLASCRWGSGRGGRCTRLSQIDGFSAEEEDLRQWLLDQADEHGNAIIEVPRDKYGAGYVFSVGAWRRFGVAEA